MELTYGHYSWTLFGVNERRVLLYLYLKILNFTSDCIFLIEYYFSINENFSPVDQWLQTVGLVNN